MPKPFLQCDRLCCIMSRDDVLVMSCYLLCPAMGWNVMSFKMLLVVRSHCVVRSGFVTMWCGGPKYCSVLRSTALCYKKPLQYYSVSTTKYYSSAARCSKETTAVLLCSTKYYSSTSLYYKVLQYYSVLQNTTPVLLCTTKHYSVQQSSTTYYNILLQFYSILQSTTPVLLRTTPVLLRTTPVLLQYYSVLLLLLLLLLLQYYAVLQSNTRYIILYYKVLLQLARSNRSHPPTSPNTVPATKKMTLMIDPRIVIYNAQSNRSQPPTSPNTAPATQNKSHDSSASHMKRHLQCAEQQASPSNLTKDCTCHAKLQSKI